MIVLLHGAIGDQTQLAALRAQLATAQTHAIDFEGHGARAMNGREFRLQHFAENLLGWLDDNAPGRVDLFGYSMGGYVALLVAALHPDRVRSVFTLGTKLRWTPDVADRMCAQLDADTIERKVPKFAEQLARTHHASGWKQVLAETCGALRALGASPLLSDELLARIMCPVRLAIGDRDNTVDVEEVRDAARMLTRGQYEVLPHTPHPMERVPLERLVWTLQQFHSSIDLTDAPALKA